MLEKIRIALFKNALHSLFVQQKRNRFLHNTQSAQTIGLLFDATKLQDRKEVLVFTETLEKKGKKVDLLGFFNQREAPDNSTFPNFNQKDLSWIYIPKSENALQFAQKKHDLLICLNPAQMPALAWVALKNQALMKIGLAGALANDFDLQLDVPENKGPQYFFDQMLLYLNKLS
ncbi:MAG: hypothetical protein KGS48_12075 [Bacteroidetes bacterium]|nr:hypothetical protein [Bacteroidota bacterium]